MSVRGPSSVQWVGAFLITLTRQNLLQFGLIYVGHFKYENDVGSFRVDKEEFLFTEFTVRNVLGFVTLVPASFVGIVSCVN